MKKRLTIKRYQKEYEELMNKTLKLLNHHYSRVICNFLNEVGKLNKMYLEGNKK